MVGAWLVLVSKWCKSSTTMPYYATLSKPYACDPHGMLM
jgi:hypothetical protein